MASNCVGNPDNRKKTAIQLQFWIEVRDSKMKKQSVNWFYFMLVL